jgi:hypothetical protein
MTASRNLWVLFYSATAYWRFAATGGCLYNKQFDLFVRFANISLEHNWNAIEKGYFLLQEGMISQKKKTESSICREKRYYWSRRTCGQTATIAIMV